MYYNTMILCFGPVAVPPMLENRTSAINTGTGSKLST